MTSPENSKQQGDLGVALAIAYYTTKKKIVSVPLSDNARYDLVVDTGILKRVQCKTSDYTTKNGNYEVQLRTNGGNQSWSGTYKKLSKFETDLVFIYTLDGRMWEIPSEILHDRSTVTMYSRYDEFEVHL